MEKAKSPLHSNNSAMKSLVFIVSLQNLLLKELLGVYYVNEDKMDLNPFYVNELGFGANVNILPSNTYESVKIVFH